MLSLFMFLFIGGSLLAQKKTDLPKIPIKPFSEDRIFPAPKYDDLYYWAAHPDKKDNADRTPSGIFEDKQATAEVDVFYLYPTVYNRTKGYDQWNAPVDDDDFNQKVDDSAILNQATPFNGAGRVYAPRYRQAHIHGYFSKDKESVKKAFALAYEDIRAAFQYYLDNFNNGRPIILASHSQGTTHAGPLMKEFFDGKPLQGQLVAAYTVGMPVPRNYFENIKPCESPEDTGCFCTWRTWAEGHLPDYHAEEKDKDIVVTNPLNWKTDSTYAPREMNKGGVLYKFDKGIKKALCDAWVHKGILWVNRPRFFGSRLIKLKNYHVGDFNLFYTNVRENAILRAQEFLRKEERGTE